MESCEADMKKQCQRNGTAYIVIREEKNVNELGNNVPSLVPYDYSDEEEEKEDEKEQTEDGTRGSPSDTEVYIPDEWFDDDSSEDDDWVESYSVRRRGPQAYNIWASVENYDDSHCIGILKDNGCSESCFVNRYRHIPGCFIAKLDWEQFKKLEGDSRIHHLGPAEDVCSC